MRSKHILIALSVIAAMAAVAGVTLAGNLDPTDGPTEPGSQMYTLEQIYERLDTGAEATKMTQFTEPAAGPGSTMHTLDEIYDLAGRAVVPKTGQAAVNGTRDDGELQTGVAWPSPRFSRHFAVSSYGMPVNMALPPDPDPSARVVKDHLTGLIWLADPDCFTARKWSEALSAANGLKHGICGLVDGSSAGDWRLPNVRELQSLVHYGVNNPAVPNTMGNGKWTSGEPFDHVKLSTYWSSTTLAGTSGSAWYVDMSDGNVSSADKGGNRHVWPVRGGQ